MKLQADFVDMVERFDTKSSRLDLTAYTEIFNKKAGGTYYVYWNGSQAECISTNKNAPMSAIKKFDVIRFRFLRASQKAEVKVLKKTNRDRAVNKPRPGSSKGKIGRTRVIGAKKVLKDFEALTRTLQGLIRKHGKGDTKTLQKAFKAVRTGVTTKG